MLTHRKSHTREHQCWSHMKARCGNPKHQAWSNYGGRGIKVCDRWVNSFENFFSDMGKRPDGCVLDRINNDGDYTPENCRWTTYSVSSKNRRPLPARGTRFITAFGRTQHVGAWSRERGISSSLIRWRLKNGWSAERALSMRTGPIKAAIGTTDTHPTAAHHTAR